MITATAGARHQELIAGVLLPSSCLPSLPRSSTPSALHERDGSWISLPSKAPNRRGCRQRKDSNIGKPLGARSFGDPRQRSARTFQRAAFARIECAARPPGTIPDSLVVAMSRARTQHADVIAVRLAERIARRHAHKVPYCGTDKTGQGRRFHRRGGVGDRRRTGRERIVHGLGVVIGDEPPADLGNDLFNRRRRTWTPALNGDRCRLAAESWLKYRRSREISRIPELA